MVIKIAEVVLLVPCQHMVKPANTKMSWIASIHWFLGGEAELLFLEELFLEERMKVRLRHIEKVQ